MTPAILFYVLNARLLLSLQVLHLVDFDQLKIENQQHLERIDAKNRELLQLKLSTGRTVQVRNDVW
jgi:hypothetical protein